MRTRSSFITSIALVLMVLGFSPAAAQSGRRVALLVGNGAYQKLPALKNPANDAMDMGATLKRLGFDTEVLVDTNYQSLMEAAERFAGRLAGAEAGLFFYAGHGVQSAGVNYLIPVDAVIDQEYQLKFKTVSADYILEAMDSSGCTLSMVFLDACRNNPFASVRSLSRGLAMSTSSPTGAIIAYATDPGKTAADGAGRNGIFTSAILNHIGTPGLDIKEILDRVGSEVAETTRQEQTPWVSSKFYGKFYFVAGTGVAAAGTAPAGAKPDRGLAVIAGAASAAAAASAPTPAAPVGTGSIVLAAPADAIIRGSGPAKFESHGGISADGLPSGSYNLEASGPGYTTTTAKVELKAGDNYRWEPWLAGSLSFASKPAGASLFIDDRPYGTAPLVTRDIAPGVVALKAELEGYGRWYGRAEIVTGKTTQILASMPPDSYHGEILVHGGTFRMGSTADKEAERPIHEVTLSDFYIMATEVDQSTWERVMKSKPSKFKGPALPVEQVSWLDAVIFANRLSVLDGLEPCYVIAGLKVTCDFSHSGWRLPTESEWEYAARGGSSSRGFAYAGASDAMAVGWYKDNSKASTQATGVKTPNELGLFDMSGNVWEWCWDWLGTYTAYPDTDPRGPPDGKSRIARGGSWSDDASVLRSTRRGFSAPDQGYAIIGFRLARRR